MSTLLFNLYWFVNCEFEHRKWLWLLFAKNPFSQNCFLLCHQLLFHKHWLVLFFLWEENAFKNRSDFARLGIFRTFSCLFCMRLSTIQSLVWSWRKKATNALFRAHRQLNWASQEVFVPFNTSANACPFELYLLQVCELKLSSLSWAPFTVLVDCYGVWTLCMSHIVFLCKLYDFRYCLLKIRESRISQNWTKSENESS